MGGTVTHKEIILRKVILAGKDPAVVAREPGQSLMNIRKYNMVEIFSKIAWICNKKHYNEFSMYADIFYPYYVLTE